MTDLVDRCFKEQLATPEWQKMKIMIPSYGQTLNDKPELLSEIRNNTATVLKLTIIFK
jgi:malate dehydrogenase (quinone)